jgi:hypothetical protein
MNAPTIDAKALDELEAMRSALPEGVWSVPDDATNGLDEAAHCCAGSDGSHLVAFSVTTDRALQLARFAAALEQSFRPLIALARRGLELASAPPLDTAAILAKYDEAHREALPPEDEEGIDHEAADALAHEEGLRAVAEEAHARGLFHGLGRIHQLRVELAAAKVGRDAFEASLVAIAADCGVDPKAPRAGVRALRERAAVLEADAGALTRAIEAAMGRIDEIDDSGLELRTRARAVEARQVLARALKERVAPEAAASAPARWRHALERIRATLSWWEHGDDCPKRSCAHDDCDCPDDAHDPSIGCDCDIDAINAIVHEAIAGDGRQDLVTLAEAQEKLRQSEKSLRAAGEREARAWSRFEEVRRELGRWQTAMVDVGRALETVGAPLREQNAAGVLEAAKAMKAERDAARAVSAQMGDERDAERAKVADLERRLKAEEERRHDDKWNADRVEGNLRSDLADYRVALRDSGLWPEDEMHDVTPDRIGPRLAALVAELHETRRRAAEAGLQLRLEQEQGAQARKERNAALQREGKALRERDEACKLFWQLVGVAERQVRDMHVALDKAGEAVKAHAERADGWWAKADAAVAAKERVDVLVTQRERLLEAAHRHIDEFRERAERAEAEVSRLRGLLDHARRMMARSPLDWSVDHRDAWLWGVVVGWDDASIAELAPKHGWSEENVATLRAARETLKGGAQ